MFTPLLVSFVMASASATEMPAQSVFSVAANPSSTPSAWGGMGVFLVEPNGAASSSWWVEITNRNTGTRYQHTWISEPGPDGQWFGEVINAPNGLYDVEVYNSSGKVDDAVMIIAKKKCPVAVSSGPVLMGGNNGEFIVIVSDVPSSSWWIEAYRIGGNGNRISHDWDHEAGSTGTWRGHLDTSTPGHYKVEIHTSAGLDHIAHVSI